MKRPRHDFAGCIALALAAPLLIGLPSTAGAADVATVVAQFEQMTLAPGTPARSVAGMSWSAGDLQLTLTSGSLATVEAGGGRIGFFFEGKGRFRFTSTSRDEAAALRHNVDRSTMLKLAGEPGSLVLEDEFQTALVLELPSQPTLPEGTAAPLPEAPFQRHREEFGRDGSPPASHLFALHQLNGGPHPFVRVELAAGRHRLVYEREAVVFNRATLYCLKESEARLAPLRRYLWPIILSQIPIGRDPRSAPPRRLDLTQVTYDLRALEKTAAQLRVEETLVARMPGQRVLRLELNDRHLVGNGAGLAEGTEKVERVTDSSGAPLSFSQGIEQLLVELKEPVAPEIPFKLSFEISGDFLQRPLNDNYWRLVGAWFPMPDLVAQGYTMRGTIRVPAPFLPVASGRTVARRTEGSQNILEVQDDNPTRFHTAAAGNFSIFEKRHGAYLIRVVSYGGANPHSEKQLAELAGQIIPFFEHFLGKFPYEEYQIVEINDYGWGQAPPGMMFITREAFESRLDPLAYLYTTGVNERFAHEIAHQYWGHVVGWPTAEEQWLSEAFAEYCAALLVNRAQGKVEFESIIQGWKEGARLAHEKAPIPLANRLSTPLDPWDAYRMRNYLLYSKGPLVLRWLHERLGDQAFLTFLKSYQKSFRWRLGSTSDVIGLLKFMTQNDYSPEFERWYWGLEIPPVNGTGPDAR